MRNEATLPILLFPDSRLRAKARNICGKDGDAVRALVPQMFAAMYAAPGIGLAAPQVGETLRLVVVDLQPDATREPIVLVNPEIIGRSRDLVVREEGCLSVPGQYADVERAASVKVRWRDLDGMRRELVAEGLMATCLQHEIDHLDGVMFVDHLTPLRRNMLLRRFNKGQKNKARED